MPDILHAENLLPALAPWRESPRWWLGLSGGVDSTVLLDLLVRLREHHAIPPITAVHVNHQLQHQALDWQQHCEQLCAARGVAYLSQAAQVLFLGEGPEAAARRARYQVFESLLQQGDLLLLAHHLDDQIETFFLRLMRGAGAHGLAGMPVSRPLGAGALLRPLLSVSRQSIVAHARAHGLVWQEDVSNSDTAIDRNFLRQRLLPVLGERWPGYRSSILRSQGALSETEREQRGHDHARLANASAERRGEGLLDLAQLSADSPDTLARLLRRWLGEQGLVLPAADRLLEFARQLQEAAPDRRPSLEGEGYSLHRYQTHLYRVNSVSLPAEPLWLMPEAPLELPGLGVISAVPDPNGGLRLPQAGAWSLRWRQGGERCQPLTRHRSQSLKKLLQETGLPPWQRDRLPLLYAGDQLAAVADLWVCQGAEVDAEERGYKVLWEPF